MRPKTILKEGKAFTTNNSHVKLLFAHKNNNMYSYLWSTLWCIAFVFYPNQEIILQTALTFSSEKERRQTCIVQYTPLTKLFNPGRSQRTDHYYLYHLRSVWEIHTLLELGFVSFWEHKAGDSLLFSRICKTRARF